MKLACLGEYVARADGATLVSTHGRHLLTVGLEGLEGAVYLDDQDREMIVTRTEGMQPLFLADCHVPVDLRFTFYDQVHTTGDLLKTASPLGST